MPMRSAGIEFFQLSEAEMAILRQQGNPYIRNSQKKSTNCTLRYVSPEYFLKEVQDIWGIPLKSYKIKNRVS
jgi:hypothetical protein